MAYIYSKNAVREAILNNISIKHIYTSDLNNDIAQLAKKKNLSLIYKDNKELSKMISEKNAKIQGVVCEIQEYKYYPLEELLEKKGKYPFLVMLDSLEDPHNLGAILRTCDAANVDGVIIPKNRSVSLNDTVAKVSTGAIEYVKVASVTNLNQTIEKLKDLGYWIVGAEYDENSKFYTELKYDMPICLVIGSEGKGISSLVKKNCDFLVKIPMLGHVNSLNASVSASILIYEIIKYR